MESINDYKPTPEQLEGIAKHEIEQAIIRAKVEANWLKRKQDEALRKTTKKK